MTAPIKFHPPKEKEEQIRIKCKDADENVVKESCPKYTGTHPENLLKMIIQLKVLEQHYNWHGDNKTDFIIQNLGQALDGRAAKKQSNLTHAHITSASMYKIQVQELVKELLGEDAEDKQKQYLEDTTKLNYINAIKYAERVKEINKYIEWFLPTAISFSKSYLTHKSISKFLRIYSS